MLMKLNPGAFFQKAIEAKELQDDHNQCVFTTWVLNFPKRDIPPQPE